jgi:hypothetical protein
VSEGPFAFATTQFYAWPSEYLVVR